MTKENVRKKAKQHRILCICGMAGSGKSTVAKKLAAKYGLRYYSGGDALKALAMEEGYKNIPCGWWESKEGMDFLERRRKNQEFDEAIDKKLVELARQGNVMLDSWTMPWLLKTGFKIWLEASPEVRANRLAERDGISVEEASEALRIKEAQTKSIYKELYGFNLGEDYKPFDLVLDTENLNAEEVFQVLCMAMENYFLRSSAR
jgi:cytidylate kinase